MPTKGVNWKHLKGQWSVTLPQGGTWATYICGANDGGALWGVVHIDVVDGGTQVLSHIKWVDGLIWQVQ